MVTFVAGLQVPDRSPHLRKKITEATSQGEKATGARGGGCAATCWYGLGIEARQRVTLMHVDGDIGLFWSINFP